MFEDLLGREPYSIPQEEKSEMMLKGLQELTEYHYEKCPAYARVIDGAWGGLKTYKSIEDVPYIPVGMFKMAELSSTDTPSIVMRSSGTTGQTPSRIYVDNETATRQAHALTETFSPILGKRRRPFLVIDTKDVLKATDLTARGAGVLGMMKFGARATFALSSELEVDKDAIRDFLKAIDGQPFLIFGFTFLVWTKLYQSFEDGEIDLSHAVLVHSGGWKKLESEKVSNSEFRAAMKKRFNMTKIYNFYGFVEQIGSVFIEGEKGLLYPPNFTEVIIRNPETWEPAKIGEEGVIQVVSLLPRSYPGHSVLTEDKGTVVSVDEGGRLGRGITISGRVAKAELRGCSDVIAASQQKTAS